jgi:hypothetical protein
MMELSRASGRKAAILLLRSRAQRAANPAIPEIRNQPVRRMAKRLCACAGALALAVFAGIGARAQQQTPTAPVGDIYESGAPQPVEQAFQKLYEIAAEITANPGSLYVQGQVDESNWPTVDQAQAQWDNAVSQAANALTQDQRNNIIPCAAHLNNAIADMERGYIIHITQESNPPAQSAAQADYGEAKDEFAKCLASGVATDAGSTPGTTGGGTPEPGNPAPSNPAPSNPATGGPAPPGEPETPSSGETPETPPPTQLFGAAPGDCGDQPYDVRADVPSATPQIRYALGFERGTAACLESQVTAQNIAAAALAAKYKAVAALLLIAATPSVIDGVLHPPGASTSTNPYQKGMDEGGRLCTWMFKVAPAAIARQCPAATGPAATCSAASLSTGLSQAMGAAAGEAPARLDCFLCTLAWLRGDKYTPPSNGGAPWNLTQIEQFLGQQYGKQTPQGPALPCWRQAAQAKGIPGSMSPQGIESEMAAAGDGAQGFIFMVDPAAKNGGHVFGVKTQGSGDNAQVIYWDEQQQMPGDWWFTPGLWTSLYRTK